MKRCSIVHTISKPRGQGEEPNSGEPRPKFSTCDNPGTRRLLTGSWVCATCDPTRRPHHPVYTVLEKVFDAKPRPQRRHAPIVDDQWECRRCGAPSFMFVGLVCGGCWDDLTDAVNRACGA